MKIYKQYNKIYIDFTNDLFIESINDWAQLWGKWNWISFHFLHIYAENDIWTGGAEFELAVLGLGFRIRYNYNDKLKKLEKRLK